MERLGSVDVGTRLTIMSYVKMLTRMKPASGLGGPDTIAANLANFINASIMARGHPVQPDDDLEMAGVDSMALLKILLFIETEYGFWMPDEDLVEENIATVRALANYIGRRGTPP
jgi:acyl carrier protein